jgi:hypothetical protein
MKLRLITLVALVCFAVAPISLFAQSQAPCAPPPCTTSTQVTCCTTPSAGTAPSTGGGGIVADISPYGGFIWPGSFSGIGDFQNNQILGVKGGFFATSAFEIGGNFYWNNHFQPNDANVPAAFAGLLGFPQGSVKAFVWEPEFTYHFGAHGFFGSAVRPYVVGSIGGLTTHIKNSSSVFVLNTRPVDTPTGVIFVPNDVLDNNNTFLTFSYGGGIKASRLWGPMGVFGDFRGRTVPNFFGHGNTWPEISAGLNFAWGEK